MILFRMCRLLAISRWEACQYVLHVLASVILAIRYLLYFYCFCFTDACEFYLRLRMPDASLLPAASSRNYSGAMRHGLPRHPPTAAENAAKTSLNLARFCPFK